MTYAVISLVCTVIAAAALVVLFSKRMPPPEQLRVDWGRAPMFSSRSMVVGATKLRFAGPDRYCPTCGRLLVKVHEDGTFDLAALSGLESTVEINIAEGVPDQVETLVIEATCLICNPEEGRMHEHAVSPA